MPTRVGLRRWAHSTNIQVSAATAVATCVTVIAMPACIPAVTAEPALKPNQPTTAARPNEGEHDILRWTGILALAEHQGAHQAGDTCVDMNHRTAGEVEHFNARGVVRAVQETVWSQTQCAIGA